MPTFHPSSKARLEALSEEATVDAYGCEEQTGGFFTMIEEHLALPFTVSILGVEAVVEKVDLTRDSRIVAVCRHDGVKQMIEILDLPLPKPIPAGADPGYIARMEDVLELYERPLCSSEPVVCIDEKPVVLPPDLRACQPMLSGRVARRDYEYKGCGTANLFCGTESKAGRHFTKVTPTAKRFLLNQIDSLPLVCVPGLPPS